MITAQLNNYRQSPRKVRVVANLLKGKQVDNALTICRFTSKRASGPISSLVLSAIANAKSQGVSRENLFVKEIRVDQGVTMHRRMPRARGSAYPINKRTSHVSIVLEDKSAVAPKIEKAKVEKAKPAVKKAEKVETKAEVKPKKVVKKAEPKTK